MNTEKHPQPENLRFEIARRLGWKINQVGKMQDGTRLYHIFRPNGKQLTYYGRDGREKTFYSEHLLSWPVEEAPIGMPRHWDTNLEDALTLWKDCPHRIDMQLMPSGTFRCAPDIPNCTNVSHPSPAYAVAKTWLRWQEQLEREAQT